MYLDKEGNFVRTDIWREGKWLDLWSVVHFFSGVTMGFFPRYLGLEAFPAYIIVFLLLVIYEMFEMLANIRETPQNRTMDIVVGMASFTFSFQLSRFLSEADNLVFGAVFLVISSTSGFVGWRASRKAVVFEAKLREKIKRGRERLEHTRLGERLQKWESRRLEKKMEKKRRYLTH